MRRAYVVAMAFLVAMVMGPAAHAIGEYTLDDGGQVPAGPILNEFDLDDSDAEDVTFAVEGDVTVTLACEKETPKKTIEKTRIFEYEIDEAVDYDLVTEGLMENPVRYDLDDVDVPDIRTTCPGAPGGWETMSSEMDVDIDLVVYYDGEDWVLMNGTVELED